MRGRPKAARKSFLSLNDWIYCALEIRWSRSPPRHMTAVTPSHQFEGLSALPRVLVGAMIKIRSSCEINSNTRHDKAKDAPFSTFFIATSVVTSPRAVPTRNASKFELSRSVSAPFSLPAVVKQTQQPKTEQIWIRMIIKRLRTASAQVKSKKQIFWI